MKTTELYLEQVLIGFLIIFIGAFPWIPVLWSHAGDIKTGMSIIGGSAALGFAFFIGIPFDRLADTLSDRLEQHSRLKAAIAALKPPPPPKPTDRNGAPIDDPYPEDMLLIACRRDQSVVRALDYLRSRVRLTRALAAYAPALTLIATLSVDCWQTEDDIAPARAAVWFGLVAAAYLAWALLVSMTESLPRTHDTTGRFKQYQDRPPAACYDGATYVVPALVLIASIAAGSMKACDHPLVLAAALGGATLTILSTWSWWRISKTYRAFLLDCWKFGNPGAAKAT